MFTGNHPLAYECPVVDSDSVLDLLCMHARYFSPLASRKATNPKATVAIIIILVVCLVDALSPEANAPYALCDHFPGPPKP